MDGLPFIDLELAGSAGAAWTPPGPRLAREEIAEVVDGLRAAAAASVAPVAEVTRLSVPAAGDMPVIDRRTWVRANVEMVGTMLAEVAAADEAGDVDQGDVAQGDADQGDADQAALRRPATVKQRLEARANALQIAGALAMLSTRVLGQYVPFGAEPRLVLVAPNVAHVERELGLVHADFRLWVCLHEQTHRLQFAQAPWLRGYLIRQLGLLMDDAEAGPRALRLPTSVVDAVLTPAQRVVFDKVSAAMSLLEGYADVMMDRVGPEVVPTVGEIRQRFEARRDRGGWRRAVNKLMGLDLKLAQYRDGAAFCRAVIERVGVEGLNEVYAGAGLLPSLEEIHAPQRWVDRVHPGA